jgi:hypothetical protein
MTRALLLLLCLLPAVEGWAEDSIVRISTFSASEQVCEYKNIKSGEYVYGYITKPKHDVWFVLNNVQIAKFDKDGNLLEYHQPKKPLEKSK